jgi:hypothetical protein
VNRCITLPIIGRQQFIDGLTREEVEAGKKRPGIVPRREFPFLVVQPEAARLVAERLPFSIA